MNNFNVIAFQVRDKDWCSCGNRIRIASAIEKRELRSSCELCLRLNLWIRDVKHFAGKEIRVDILILSITVSLRSFRADGLLARSQRRILYEIHTRNLHAQSESLSTKRSVSQTLSSSLCLSLSFSLFFFLYLWRYFASHISTVFHYTHDNTVTCASIRTICWFENVGIEFQREATRPFAEIEKEFFGVASDSYSIFPEGPLRIQ